jgi:hypothetical protein
LEDRKVLAAIAYVNDTWVKDSFSPGDEVLSAGDTVFSIASLDPVSFGITGDYGGSAFGKVRIRDGVNLTLLAGTLSLAGSTLIDDAIDNGVIDNNGDTVSLLEGTYTESDIIIDKGVLFKGSGVSGSGDTLIVPEVASTRAESEFPSGSHSAIIIYSQSVTVSNLHVNGSGNGGVGTFQYHHGITTLYDGTVDVNEIQYLDPNGATGGTFTLTFNPSGDSAFTTAGIAYNADAATVEAAIDAASTITGWAAGHIDVTGGPAGGTGAARLRFTYSGASVDTENHGQMTVDGTGLTGGGAGGAGTIANGQLNDGFTYSPVRDGTLTVKQLGIQDDENAPNRSRPAIAVLSVTVDNVWYHGITISAAKGQNFGRDDGGPELEVGNSIVNNVGDVPANQGANHIGILMQNLDDYNTGDPGGAPATPGGNAYGNTINNAGIGLASNAYGTRSWNSRANARNDTTYSLNTVNNPVTEAYRMEFLSGGDFIANVANFSPGNTAIGIHGIRADMSYLGRAEDTAGSGFYTLGQNAATGPFIGIQLEDSDVAGVNAGPIISVLSMFGPGTGTPGSVGILADNNGPFGGANTDTSFLASVGVNITNFETGVKIIQNAASTVATLAFLDRLGVSGNKTGYVIDGANGTVLVHGMYETTDPVIDPDTTIGAQFLPNILASYTDNLASQPTQPAEANKQRTISSVVNGGSTVTTTSSLPGTWADGQAVTFIVGTGDDDELPKPLHQNGPKYFINVTGASTFTVHNSLADALAATNPVVFTSVGVGTTHKVNITPPDPSISNAAEPKPDVIRTGNLTLGSGTVYTPLLNGDSGASATLFLQDFNTATTAPVTSDLDHVNPWGTGFLNPARLGSWSASAVDRTNGSTLRVGVVAAAPNLGAIYELPSTTMDARDYGYLQIRVKHGGLTMNAKNFFITVVDLDGTSDLYSFSTEGLTTAGYSTLTSNLLTPPVRFVAGDGIMNWSAIAGWAVAGDFGSTTSDTTKRLSLEIDDIAFIKGPRASNFSVTGTVTLSGATLAPVNNGRLYVSSIGQQFTVLNNDSTDAISGTFAGLPQGGYVNVGTDKYQIDYSAGSDSNDVVLTQVTNTAPTVDLNGADGGTGFSSTWDDTGPINITDSDATVTDPDDTMIASMTATIVSGVHANNVLSADTTGTSINASYGSGTLTLSGADTLANYQTVLRTIEYDNTAGGPGAGSVTVNIQATDPVGGLSNVAVASITIDLGAGSVVARRLFYNQSSFDGPAATNASINSNDDNAIATDKTAYLPGAGQAVYANLSNYSRGINGIMIDLSAGSGTHASINANDFIFKVGNNNSPSTWAAAAAPNAISVRTGAGVSASDRVEITWATNAVKNTWLEVQVLATSHTGLGATDVFFWGNRVGDVTSPATGSTFVTNVSVDGGGIVGVSPAGAVGITNRFDVNKTNSINLSGDRGEVVGNSPGSLLRINIGTGGPFAPEGGGGGGGDAGISSALAGSSGSSDGSADLPASVGARLDTGSSSSGVVTAAYYEQVADSDDGGDEDDDDSGVDDETLDSLASGL